MTAAAAPAERADVRGVAALVAVDLLARTSYGLSRTPLLPLYAASLGAGPALLGTIGAASTLTGIVLKSPAGALSDAVGRRRLLLAGLVVFAAGPFLYVALPFVAALVAIRLFHGLATAVYGPVSMAAVASLAGARRGECLSWLSNAKTIGALAGAFLGGLLLSAGVGAALGGTTGGPRVAGVPPDAFAGAWLVAGAFGVASLLGGALVLRRLPEDARPASRRSAFGKMVSGIREVAADGQVLLASSCEAVQNVSVGLVEQFLPIYAVLVAGRSALDAGVLFLVQTVSTLVAKPLFGRVSDRHGRRGLVVAGMLACAVPFAALPWVSGMPALLALAAAFGLGEALVTSASAALVTDLCERRSLGAAMGVFGTIGDVGHAAGPLLGGALLAAWGVTDAFTPEAAPAFRWTFGLVGGAIALAGVGYALLSRPETPPARGSRA